MIANLLIAMCATCASAERELDAKLPEIFTKAATHYKALDAAATPLMRDTKGKLHKPGGVEIDVPLDYGDYYFPEALLRFRNLQ